MLKSTGFCWHDLGLQAYVLSTGRMGCRWLAAGERPLKRDSPCYHCPPRRYTAPSPARRARRSAPPPACCSCLSRPPPACTHRGRQHSLAPLWLKAFGTPLQQEQAAEKAENTHSPWERLAQPCLDILHQPFKHVQGQADLTRAQGWPACMPGLSRLSHPCHPTPPSKCNQSYMHHGTQTRWLQCAKRACHIVSSLGCCMAPVET